MLETGLTFRLGSTGAGKVEGDLDGIGKATKKAGEAGTKAGDASERAFKSFSDELKRSIGGLERVGKAAVGLQAGQMAFNGLVSGVQNFAAALSQATQMVVQLAQEGAKIQTLNKAFTEMGGSAEQLAQMRASTGGLISDADLIAASNMANLFGITGKNFEDLTQFAMGASMATGESMAKMLSDTMTATARGSVMILDNMGVQLGKLEDAHKKYAKGAGISVDEMTDKMKMQAFINTTLEKGTKQLALAEQAKGNKMAQSVATFENATNSIKVFFAETLTGTGILDKFVAGIGTLMELFEANKDMIERVVTVGFELMSQAFETAITNLVPLALALEPVLSLLQGMAPLIQIVGLVMGLLSTAALGLIKFALAPLAIALAGVLLALEKAASAMGLDSLAEKLKKSRTGFMDFALGADKASKGMEEAQAKAAAAAADIAKMKASTDAAKGSIDSMASATELLVAEIDKQKKAESERQKVIDALQTQASELEKSAFLNGDIYKDAEAALRDFNGENSKTAMQMSTARAVMSNFNAEFGDFGAGLDTAEAGQMVFSRALELTNGNMGAAIKLTDQYFDSLLEASKMTGGTLAADLNEQGLAIDAARNAAHKQAGVGAKKGKGNGDARRALIYEAQLIGMTEVQAEMAEVNKKLADNLKIAGANAAAIQAAQVIAARDAGALMAGEFALAGSIAAERFSTSFDSMMTDWSQRVAGRFWLGVFAFPDAVETISTALAPVAAGFGAMIGDVEAQFRAQWQNISSGFLEGLSAEIAATRTETEAFIGMFDGEATNAAAENVLFMASSIEVMSASVSDNLGTVTGALGEFHDALNMEDSAQATEAAFGALGKATAGAVKIGKTAAGAFIKDKKKLAYVMGGYEIANAVAAAAQLNFLGAASHTLAAIKYFAVSGGGAGSAKSSGGGATRQVRQKTELSGGPALLDRRANGPQQVNQYFFSVLDQKAPGEAVADALNRAARGGSNASIPQRMISAGNIQGGL